LQAHVLWWGRLSACQVQFPGVNMKSHRIALLPGDGIGPNVVAEGLPHPCKRMCFGGAGFQPAKFNSPELI
jgi:hypothetical protein